MLDTGTPAEIVRALVDEPVSGRALQARGLLEPGELAAGLATVLAAGEHYFSEAWLEGLRAEVRRRLARSRRPNPLDPGVSLAELLPAQPWAPLVANLLGVERRGAKVYLPGTAASLGERAQAASELEAQLEQEGIGKLDDRRLGAFLEERGRLRRVGDGLAVSNDLYDRGRALLATLDPITLAAFRDALGVGRKTAQLLLERYDADGLTLRRGDVRTLRRSGSRDQGSG